MDYKEIGRKIKSKRKALGLTQAELAIKTNLTESSISRYESGSIATMPTSTIKRICGVLNLNPRDLLGLTPDNAFEYDLNDIITSAKDLPDDVKEELLDILKKQIDLYRRVTNE